MSRIIGGMFGLQAVPESNSTHPPFMNNSVLCLINARSGIWILAHELSPRQIWMPSYLCSVMLEAMNTNSLIRFYEVNENLGIDSDRWLAKLQNGDLVVFIDYFGFPCDPSLAFRAKERGAWILEDASQALLSESVGQFSDFTIYSPRKYVGVPDGGILASTKHNKLQSKELRKPSPDWWLRAFSASIMRRDFDHTGGSRVWFEIFQRTERESPIGFYEMSELTKLMLLNNFNYTEIAEQRINNYQTLLSQLGQLAIFSNLPSGVVPLGFPIRVKNRDRLQQILNQNEIYPPIHWPIKGIIPEEFQGSHRLSEEIMTIPCDQRYQDVDMMRITKLILEEFDQ